MLSMSGIPTKQMTLVKKKRRMMMITVLKERHFLLKEMRWCPHLSSTLQLTDWLAPKVCLGHPKSGECLTQFFFRRLLELEVTFSFRECWNTWLNGLPETCRHSHNEKCVLSLTLAQSLWSVGALIKGRLCPWTFSLMCGNFGVSGIKISCCCVLRNLISLGWCDKLNIGRVMKTQTCHFSTERRTLKCFWNLVGANSLATLWEGE